MRATCLAYLILDLNTVIVYCEQLTRSEEYIQVRGPGQHSVSRWFLRRRVVTPRPLAGTTLCRPSTSTYST